MARSENPVDTPRRIGAAKKILFGAVLIVVPLALIEGGVRLFLGEPVDSPLMVAAEGTDESPTRLKQSELHTHDPYLIWRNRPGIDIEYKRVRVRTNSFGMRDDPVPRQKPEGEYRILSLGESTTFGSKVDQDELYSAVLERRLRERRPNMEFQVLNAGTPGWTLAQSCEYLRREGLGFEPDAILVYHGYNDFLATTMTERRIDPGAGARKGATDLELLEQARRSSGSFGAWLQERCMAVRWLVHKLKSKTPKEMDGAEAAERAGNTLRVPEADRIEVLGRLRELAADSSAELVILIPCYREFSKHRDLLLDFTEQHGVHRIDLDETVDSLGGDRRALFADGSHPKAELHAAIAERICDFLLTEILRKDD